MGACARVLDAAGELLLGAACPGCGAPVWGLCAACCAELARRTEVRWRTPGARSAAWVPGVAAVEYGGLVRRCVVAYKERRTWSLAGPLGGALAWAVAGLLVEPGPVALVPVPSSAAAVRERGEDHAWLLARSAAGHLRRAGVGARAERGLRQVRRTADQSGLGAEQRRANLAGSMAARGASGGPCVIVDDIATTGATLAEAVRAVQASGRPVLGTAVVAATPRRHGRDGRARPGDWTSSVGLGG